MRKNLLRALFLTLLSTLAVGFSGASINKVTTVDAASWYSDWYYNYKEGPYYASCLHSVECFSNNDLDSSMISEIMHMSELEFFDKDMKEVNKAKLRDHVVVEETDPTSYYSTNFGSWKVDINYNSSAYFIYMWWDITKDPTKAITSIWGTVDDVIGQSEPFNKIVNGYTVTYYPFELYDYNDHETIVPCDVNRSTGGDYVHLYYACDLRIGKPIEEIKIQYGKEGEHTEHHNIPGRYYVQDEYGNDIDLNSGTGDEDVYLYYYVHENYGYDINYNIEGFPTHTETKQRTIPSASNIYQPSDIAGFKVEWYLDNKFESPIVNDSIITQNTNLYGKIVVDSDQTDLTRASTFNGTFLKMNSIATSESGSGKCISENWYKCAKNVYKNVMSATAQQSLAIVLNDTEFNNAFTRIKAWANANNEDVELNQDYTFNFIENKTNSYFVTIINNDNADVSAVIFAGVFVFILSTAAFMFIKRKNKHIAD